MPLCQVHLWELSSATTEWQHEDRVVCRLGLERLPSAWPRGQNLGSHLPGHMVSAGGCGLLLEGRYWSAGVPKAGRFSAQEQTHPLGRKGCSNSTAIWRACNCKYAFYIQSSEPPSICNNHVAFSVNTSESPSPHNFKLSFFDAVVLGPCCFGGTCIMLSASKFYLDWMRFH